MNSPGTLKPSAALGLWAALAFAAALYGTWQGLGGRRFAFALAVLATLLAAQLLLAAGDLLERAVRACSNNLIAALLPLASCALYAVYAVGTGSFNALNAGLAMAYVLAPSLLLWCARERRAPHAAWEDYAALLLIWMPVELHWLQRAWPYPSGPGSGGLRASFSVSVVIVTFLLVRRLDGVGYSFAWRRGWGWTVGVSFAAIAVIVIPLGQAIGFIRFDPSLERAKMLPLSVFSIFLFNAWPEELFFRGLMQNLLARTLKNADAGWLVVSVIFGFSHINNGVFPNWRYVLLATIAGFFYGRAWRKTGCIFASALVHTLVNTTWHLLFRTL